MTKILLKIELGDWDGGNNGQYPKLIEWNLEDSDRPIEESEGWGHGLGGGNYPLNLFIQSKSFYHLGQGDSAWAHKIILQAIQENMSTSEIRDLLSNNAADHKVSIPNHLLQQLTRGVRYINA